MPYRCREWEQSSPFTTLFEGYESEVRRLEAEARQLRGQNQAMARLAAESEVAAAVGGAGK